MSTANKGVDFKAKYIALRDRTKENLDVAWRMGYEQGMKDAQMQAMQQQMEQQAQQSQQMAQAAQAQGHAEGHAAATQAASDQQPEDGDEMGQAINELEGIVNKSEIANDKLEELRKSLNKIKDSHKVKSLSFFANTTPKEQKSVSTQEKIVGDIMRKWEEEEKSAHGSILESLKKD